jgi:hypothetical protein
MNAPERKPAPTLLRRSEIERFFESLFTLTAGELEPAKCAREAQSPTDANA